MGNQQSRRKRVLFVCGSNAARSQMAEGYLRARYGHLYDVFSAGLRSSSVSPHAVEAMAEIGIDISHHTSKDLKAFDGEPMDIVILLCDPGEGGCPVFPWAKRTIHAPVPDPAGYGGTGMERLEGFRKARDMIAAWIERHLGAGL